MEPSFALLRVPVSFFGVDFLINQCLRDALFGGAALPFILDWSFLL
jgi:hypothetical protein